jgi:hypothetical protein
MAIIENGLYLFKGEESYKDSVNASMIEKITYEEVT